MNERSTGSFIFKMNMVVILCSIVAIAQFAKMCIEYGIFTTIFMFIFLTPILWVIWKVGAKIVRQFS